MSEAPEATDDARAAAIKRIKAKRGFREHLFSYIVVNAALIAIWAIGGGGYFWPAWVLGGWGIGLVFNAWSVYGPGERPITEADIADEMSKAPRR